MGTHPIFESDFDCLTETKKRNKKLKKGEKKKKKKEWKIRGRKCVTMREEDLTCATILDKITTEYTHHTSQKCPTCPWSVKSSRRTFNHVNHFGIEWPIDTRVKRFLPSVMVTLIKRLSKSSPPSWKSKTVCPTSV